MSEEINRLFQLNEIQKLKPGKIEPFTPEADTRSMEPRAGSYGDPRWVCSENVYENPVAQQQFHLKLVTNDQVEHQVLQDKLLIAARAESLDDGEGSSSIENVDSSDEQFSTRALTDNLTSETQPDESPIHILLEARGLEENKHYRIFFMFDSDDDENSREIHEEVILKGSTTHEFLPASKTITLQLAIKSLGMGNGIKSRLTWHGGSDPEGDEAYLPLSSVDAITLTGEAKGDPVRFIVHTRAANQARTRVWGEYTV